MSVTIIVFVLLIILFSILVFFIAYFLISSVFKKKYGELSELELRIVDVKRRNIKSKRRIAK